MRRRDRVGAGLAVLLMATAFCLRGAAQPAVKGTPACPCKDQSPRKLETTQQSADSIVKQGPDDTVLYTPRGAAAVTSTLRRCSQHYHPQVENEQPLCPRRPKFVEIHTVYSLDPKCVKEDTSCCTQQPIVVLAYQANVTLEKAKVPVPVVWGPPWAQWSGSTTGPDKPGEPCYGDRPYGACKPPAQWSFAMGCGFKVSRGQLSNFEHPEPARAIQPASRLSGDLTLVP